MGEFLKIKIYKSVEFPATNIHELFILFLFYNYNDFLFTQFCGEIMFGLCVCDNILQTKKVRTVHRCHHLVPWQGTMEVWDRHNLKFRHSEVVMALSHQHQPLGDSGLFFWDTKYLVKSNFEKANKNFANAGVWLSIHCHKLEHSVKDNATTATTRKVISLSPLC